MIDFRVDKDLCVGCGECVADCPAMIIEMTGEIPAIAPEKEARCIGCRHCLAVCPSGAVSILGEQPKDDPAFGRDFPSPASLLSLIKGRRSVRRYRKTPVDKERLAVLMDAVLHAPTAKNVRDGAFLLVDDPAVMDEIRSRCRQGIANALEKPDMPPRFAADADYYRLVLASDKDPVFRGAPHMLVSCYNANNVWGRDNCYIALSYFELLAQSMGLGTVWCGRAWQVFTYAAPDVLTDLGLPGDQRPGYVMLFGLPDVTYHRAPSHDPAAYLTAAWK